uniref:KxDL domain-containing protein n=1 Tax=Quercus lobata TaxID=97700 RepID=A0A7N2LSY2_QUELO
MEMEQTEKEAIRAASAEVSREFKTLINADDLDSLKQSQHLILGRLQDSNAVLAHFNEYSEHCFSEVSGDFSRNTRLLRSMKSDLDYIFQKLRATKDAKKTKIGRDWQRSRMGWQILMEMEICNRSMKSRILATYPDAFPDDSTGEVVDRRPDLEIPQ